MADATNAARELADEKDVDLDQVEGTGKDGRVTKADVEAWEDDGGSVDTAEDIEVEVATKEDQAEQAEAALEAHDIDPEDLYAKEAVLPPNVQPSGGVLPPVEDQVGSPLTEAQLLQLAEQQAAIEAIAERTGWEGEKQPDPLAPDEDAEPEEVDEPEVEPLPSEALAQRKAESDDGPLPGSAEQRQRDGASEESARNPLLQRPATRLRRTRPTRAATRSRVSARSTTTPPPTSTRPTTCPAPRCRTSTTTRRGLLRNRPCTTSERPRSWTPSTATRRMTANASS